MSQTRWWPLAALLTLPLLGPALPAQCVAGSYPNPGCTRGCPIPSSKTSIEAKLAAPISFEFHEMPFRCVVQDLREVTGLNIIVDEPVLAEAGFDFGHPVTIKLEHVSLRSALNVMLRPMQLDYAIKDDTLCITSSKQGRGGLLPKCYPVADLLDAADGSPEALLEEIVRIIAPHTWNQYGGSGCIDWYPQGQALVVEQTGEIHQQLSDFLDYLRCRVEKRKLEKDGAVRQASATECVSTPAAKAPEKCCCPEGTRCAGGCTPDNCCCKGAVKAKASKCTCADGTKCAGGCKPDDCCCKSVKKTKAPEKCCCPEGTRCAGGCTPDNCCCKGAVKAKAPEKCCCPEGTRCAGGCTPDNCCCKGAVKCGPDGCCVGCCPIQKIQKLPPACIGAGLGALLGSRTKNPACVGAVIGGAAGALSGGFISTCVPAGTATVCMPPCPMMGCCPPMPAMAPMPPVPPVPSMHMAMQRFFDMPFACPVPPPMGGPMACGCMMAPPAPQAVPGNWVVAKSGDGIKISGPFIEGNCERISISSQDGCLTLEGKVHLKISKAGQKVEVTGSRVSVWPADLAVKIEEAGPMAVPAPPVSPVGFWFGGR